MSLENISNEDFWLIIQDIIISEPIPEFSEENLTKIINDELAKPYIKRDYPLIHECFLTLSECYDYSYNNEFEELSEKQIKRRRAIREFKQLFVKSKTAVF